MPRLLVGWQGRDSIEGGVPPFARRVLSQALTSLGSLAFLAPAQADSSASGGAPNSMLARLRQGLAHLVPPAAPAARWVRTGDPLAAEALFDVPGFAWSQRAQIGLLCSDAAVLPEPTVENFDNLLGPAWANPVGDLLGHGVLAVLRPGVDGDVALLLSSNPGVEQRLRAALQRSASAAGAALSEHDESTFAQRLGD